MAKITATCKNCENSAVFDSVEAMQAWWDAHTCRHPGPTDLLNTIASALADAPSGEAALGQARAVEAALAASGHIEWAIQDSEGLHPPGQSSTSETERDEMLEQIASVKVIGIDMTLVSRLTWPWTPVSA